MLFRRELESAADLTSRPGSALSRPISANNQTQSALLISKPLTSKPRPPSGPSNRSTPIRPQSGSQHFNNNSLDFEVSLVNLSEQQANSPTKVEFVVNQPPISRTNSDSGNRRVRASNAANDSRPTSAANNKAINNISSTSTTNIITPTFKPVQTNVTPPPSEEISFSSKITIEQLATDIDNIKLAFDQLKAEKSKNQSEQYNELYIIAYKTLKCVPNAEASLLAKLISVILQFPFESTEINNKCYLLSLKRLFDLSSNNSNDNLIILLIPLLISTLSQSIDHNRDIRSIVYIITILMNFSLDSNNQQFLLDFNLIRSLILLLDENILLQQLKLQDNDTKVKLVIEITNLLRNIACVAQSYKFFNQSHSINLGNNSEENSTNCIVKLCVLLDSYSNNPVLLLNIVRIFSKLSLHSSSRIELFSQPQALVKLIELLNRYHMKLAFCIRVCFILGNLTMQEDSIRSLIADSIVSNTNSTSEDGENNGNLPNNPSAAEFSGVEVLCSLFQRSLIRDSKLRKALVKRTVESNNKYAVMLRENDDLLIKLIRCIANLAINQEIGPKFLANPAINFLYDVLHSKTLAIHEELLLNTISAITNLSFYFNPNSNSNGEENPFLAHSPEEILNSLTEFLFSNNPEILSETCRTLGNLSRSGVYRNCMQSLRVAEAILLLLDHSEYSVVYGACGVILNLASDTLNSAVRQQFFHEECSAIDKLLDALERFALQTDNQENNADRSAVDFPMATIILKSLLNLRVTSAESKANITVLLLPTEVETATRSRIAVLTEELIHRVEESAEKFTAQNIAPENVLNQIQFVLQLSEMLISACALH
jgi:hypothetical protein